MFTTDYGISMPLSGIAVSSFERKADGKFAYLDYDVQKGLKWNMKLYKDAEKKLPFLEIEQKKLSVLAGQSAYEIKDLDGDKVIGAWVPKKRFLNIFLRAKYEFVVDGVVRAVSPGESFMKLFIPHGIRKLFARKINGADGKRMASVRVVSTLGSGTVYVKFPNGQIPENDFALPVAVLASICGLQE